MTIQELQKVLSDFCAEHFESFHYVTLVVKTPGPIPPIIIPAEIANRKPEKIGRKTARKR